MADHDTTLAELLQTRHPEIPLFVLFMRPTVLDQPPSSPQGAEMLRQHLLFLWELEEEGVLFASGPLDFRTPDQEGMCILAVKSRDEADAIAAREPFHKAGWRETRVRAWNLNEGSAVALGKAIRAEHASSR